MPEPLTLFLFLFPLKAMNSQDGTYYLNALYDTDPVRPFEQATEIIGRVKANDGKVESSRGDLGKHRRVIIATFPGKSNAEKCRAELQSLGYAVGIHNADEHNKTVAEYHVTDLADIEEEREWPEQFLERTNLTTEEEDMCRIEQGTFSLTPTTTTLTCVVPKTRGFNC